MANEIDNDAEHTKILEWVSQYDDATSEARRLAERDRDYVDGKQWTSSETAELQKRGQPAVVVNLIAKKVEYLIGSEIRTRTDPEALPRTEQETDGAQAITDALRYAADTNNLNVELSDAFDSFVVEGVAAVIVDVEGQERPIAADEVAGSTEDGAEMVSIEVAQVEYDPVVRVIPWDRIIYDPYSRKWNFSDARWVGIDVWMDRDEATEIYGDDAVDLLDTVMSSTAADYDTRGDRPKRWADSKRKRVRVTEIYYRRRGDWYVCHLTGEGFLPGHEPQLVQYLDDSGATTCPLLVVSALVDRENARRGLVRDAIWPQDEVNKRRSKALHELSQPSFVYEDGAVDAREAAAQLGTAGGAVRVTPGMRFELLERQSYAQSHLALLAEAKSEIHQTGPDAGVSGDGGNGMSGRGILALQQAMSLHTERALDRWRWLKRSVHEQLWYRIRQYWTSEKWLRVRDDAGQAGYRFTGLNVRTTKGERAQELMRQGMDPREALQQVDIDGAAVIGQQALQQVSMYAQQTGQQIPPEVAQQEAIRAILASPGAQAPFVSNDVSAIGVDIIISEAPDTMVIQQEEFAELSQLAGQGIPISPRVIIEASHLRNKKKLLEMMDAPDPAQQASQQMGQQMGQAQLAKISSEAQRNQAMAAKAMSEAQGAPIKAQGHQAKALRDVAQAGQIVGGSAGPNYGSM